MKQVLQNLRSGIIEVADVPCPRVRPNNLLIQTRRTLISAGTERSFVEFGNSGWIQKARQQPDQVKRVVEKIKTDGVGPTVAAVVDRLDAPTLMGYCNSGVVLEVGSNVLGFSPGDRVASNGPHAEVVSVPRNLCAKIPDGVSDEEAAFTVVGSIGLQGVRLIQPALGECIAVIGLGLIGLTAVQILRAGGCRVLGLDKDSKRLELARSYGAQVVDVGAGGDAVRAAEAFCPGGVDGVLITASSRSDEIIHEAAQMCRKRGRIVLVGVIGLALRRDDFYKKELTFQVSCSYGPGRYDPAYEDQGHDYPLPYVRWTEGRNMETILSLMQQKTLRVGPLISRVFDHACAPEAYAALTSEQDLIGIILRYPEGRADRSVTIHYPRAGRLAAGTVVAGLVGAGSLCKSTLLPALAKAGTRLESIASATGVSAQYLARRFAIRSSTTDYQTILQNPEINSVFITTRHDTHARMVVDSLAAGKHTFVEKPLALTLEELRQIRDAYLGAGGLQLMVGYNRRFSPLVKQMRALLAGRSQPLCATILVNAGALPADHWAVDPLQGGRILGEGCHWIDLLVYLSRSLVRTVSATAAGRPVAPGAREDAMSVTVSMEDGSVGTLHYFPNGNRAFPKERIEVFSEGRILSLDNFRVLRGYGFKHFRKQRLFRMDKGHAQEFAEMVQRIDQGGEPLIPFEQLLNVSLATFAALESARSRQTVTVDPAILDVAEAVVPDAETTASTPT